MAHLLGSEWNYGLDENISIKVVPSVRVERTCLAAPVSKTGASANFATRGKQVHALGGDRPESNRHQWGHIPWLYR